MKNKFPDSSEDERVILDFLSGEAPVLQGTNLSREEIREELRRRNPKNNFALSETGF